jgi:uncharacterized oxidoreductase
LATRFSSPAPPAASAEAFHDRGNRVIVTGRRKALLDQITAERPGLIGLTLDLADPLSLPRLSAEIRASFPELNVLIANAGISRAEDITADGWDAADAEAIVATNILGVLRVTAAVLPLLKEQPNATLIATSSNLAFVPRADFPSYCASKAFLHSWLQSLRHQLRNIPVEVLELAPPYVQTELTGARCRLPPISLRSCNCWGCGFIRAARCWSSATAPAAGPSATASMRPPSQP